MKKFAYLGLICFGITGAFASQYKLEHISVYGGNGNSNQTLVSEISAYKGRTINQNLINTLIRQLYARNIYSNVAITQDDSTITIHLFPKTIISALNVQILGPERITKQEIKKSLGKAGFAVGDAFDAKNLTKFSTQLISYYNEIGFLNAKATPKITSDSYGHVKITYVLNEGKQAKVNSIKIVGANFYKAKNLVIQFDMRPNVSWWNLFSTSLYSKKGLDQDVQKLQKLYLTQGFAAFKLQNVVTNNIDHNQKVNIIITIAEGKRYVYGKVKLVGNIALYRKALEKIVKRHPLKGVFDVKDVNNLKNDLSNYLYNKGLAFTKVSLSPTYHVVGKNDIVNINFVISTGPVVYINNIKFLGNTYTTDKAMRSRVTQQPGTIYSPQLVDQSKGNLMRTGFFNSVTTSLGRVPGKNNVVNLTYKVVPRDTGTFSISVGYSTDDGILYQASVVKNNFLGTGNSLSLTGTTESGYKTISLGFNQPYFTRSGIGLSTNAFFSDYDNGDAISADSTDYSLLSYGITSNVSVPINNYWNYYVGATLEHNRTYGISPEYHAALYLNSIGATQFDIGANLLLVNAGITYNDLNRGYFPQSGTMASLNGSITAPVFVNRYYSASLNFEHYIPLDKSGSYVIKTHELINYENGFSGREVPFYNYYTAGGIDSVPGFESGAIGPRAIYGDSGIGVTTDRNDFTDVSDDVIGGNAMVVASLQLAVPTPFVHKAYQNNVRTKFFITAASVWNTTWTSADTQAFGVNQNDPVADIAASVGISFEWKLPIGPVVFSYAVPIKRQSFEETQFFQFSIGGTF